MINFLYNFFRPKKEKIKYRGYEPGMDQWIPAILPVCKILEKEENLILKIKKLVELVGDEEKFKTQYMPIIVDCAKIMHLLPCWPRPYHHSSMGGLWRHSLEVAFLSAKFALDYGRNSDLYNSEQDRLFAGFLLGMVHDINRIQYFIQKIEARSFDCGHYQLVLPIGVHVPLVEWLDENDIREYRVEWRGDAMPVLFRIENNCREKYPYLSRSNPVVRKYIKYLPDIDHQNFFVNALTPGSNDFLSNALDEADANSAYFVPDDNRKLLNI